MKRKGREYDDEQAAIDAAYTVIGQRSWLFHDASQFDDCAKRLCLSISGTMHFNNIHELKRYFHQMLDQWEADGSLE